MAVEAVDDARYLLGDARLKSAANRAYYGMFHAVQAALAYEPDQRHAPAPSTSSSGMVRTGRVGGRFGQDLQDAHRLRHRSDYEAFAEVGAEQVAQAVERAGAFVEAVKVLLADAGG